MHVHVKVPITCRLLAGAFCLQCELNSRVIFLSNVVMFIITFRDKFKTVPKLEKYILGLYERRFKISLRV